MVNGLKCDSCRVDIAEGDEIRVFEHGDAVTYCTPCYEERYTTCKMCFDAHMMHKMYRVTWFDGTLVYLCVDCAPESPTWKCHACGAMFHVEYTGTGMNNIQDNPEMEPKYICDNCFHIHYYRCPTCGRPTERSARQDENESCLRCLLDDVEAPEPDEVGVTRDAGSLAKRMVRFKRDDATKIMIDNPESEI